MTMQLLPDEQELFALGCGASRLRGATAVHLQQWQRLGLERQGPSENAETWGNYSHVSVLKLGKKREPLALPVQGPPFSDQWLSGSLESQNLCQLPGLVLEDLELTEAVEARADAVPYSKHQGWMFMVDIRYTFSIL